MNQGLTNTHIRDILSKGNGHLFAATSGSGIFRSTDNGNTWIKASSGLGSSIIYDLALTQQGNVLAGTYNGIWITYDNANSWVQLGLSGKRVDAVGVDSLGYIFAGVSTEGLYRSTDNGTTWTLISSDMFYIYAIKVDATGTIFVGANNGVYRSNDNGNNWNWIGLYGKTVNDMAFIENPGSLLAATSSGVYYSLDDGNTWQSANNGLTDTQVWSILITSNGYAFAGTFSGTVFRTSDPITKLSVSEVNIPKTIHLKQNYPNPFNPVTTIPFTLPKSTHVTLKIYNLLGQEVATLVNARLLAGEHRVRWEPQDLPSGVYLVRLEAKEHGVVQVRKMVLVR